MSEFHVRRYGPIQVVWRHDHWWWVRVGNRGPGLRYRHLIKTKKPLTFSERYGYDQSVAVRFGAHVFTFMRPRIRRAA